MATIPDAADLSSILARLQRLEDERAVFATLHDYCTIIDHGTEQDWVDLFTEDGVFDVRGTGDLPISRGGIAYENGIRFPGREHLARFIAGRNRDPLREQKHNTIQPLIVVDGDEATATSYYIATAWHHGALTIYGLGRYVDRLHRSADGRWRFRERVCLTAGPKATA